MGLDRMWHMNWRLMTVVVGIVAGAQVSCSLPEDYSELGSAAGSGGATLVGVSGFPDGYPASRGGGARRRLTGLASKRGVARVVRVDPGVRRSGGAVVARVVTNKAGYVYSPFVEGAKMVDVRKFSAGEQAHCPYTMRRFTVPGEVAHAAPSVDLNLRPEPRPEAPAERGRSWGRLVVATPVSDKTGYVYSPHAEERRMVDVRKFRAGDEVLCPYTMRRFVVPDEGLVRINVEKLKREQTEQNPGGRLALMELPMVASAGRDVPSSLGVTRPPETGGSAGVQRSRDGVRKTELPESPVEVRTLAVGEWVEGRPGFVLTPHGKSYQLVDVAGIAPGTEVKCPYTGKNFMVPGASKPVQQTGGKPEAAADSEGASIPMASWSGDSPGYVQSPFGKNGQVVDVTGFPAGTVVECPFSRKEFRVPQAAGDE